MPENNMFSERTVCPFCKAELDLDLEEQKSGKFICPNCNKEVTGRSDSIMQKPKPVKINISYSSRMNNAFTPFFICVLSAGWSYFMFDQDYTFVGFLLTCISIASLIMVVLEFTIKTSSLYLIRTTFYSIYAILSLILGIDTGIDGNDETAIMMVCIGLVIGGFAIYNYLKYIKLSKMNQKKI